MLPFESCMAEVEAWVDNLDLIPPVKVKLFDLFVNGSVEQWFEFCDEWPNTSKMLNGLHLHLLVKYQNDELVNAAFEALAKKYGEELKGMMKHD